MCGCARGNKSGTACTERCTAFPSLHVRQKKTERRERSYLRFLFLPTVTSFSISFIIYRPAVLSAIRIQRGSGGEPPPLSSTHTCSYDVTGDPGLPAAPPSCPTFWLRRHKISLLISCAAVWHLTSIWCPRSRCLFTMLFMSRAPNVKVCCFKVGKAA